MSWQNPLSSFSRSKVGIVRECLSRETVIGPVRSPVQVFSTCELADISQSPSSRVTACLCDTDLCNGNVGGEVRPSSQPQASRRIAPTTERPRSRPEIKETPRGGSNDRPPQRSRSLQVLQIMKKHGLYIKKLFRLLTMDVLDSNVIPVEVCWILTKDVTSLTEQTPVNLRRVSVEKLVWCTRGGSLPQRLPPWENVFQPESS